MSITGSLPNLEQIKALGELLDEMDKFFSEESERRRFMTATSDLSQHDLSLLQQFLGSKNKSQPPTEEITIDDPLRTANAILQLETTVRKSKSQSLLLFIFLLLKQKNVTKALSRIWLFPWEESLIKNKNLTAEQVRFIYLSKKTDYAKELLPYSLRTLVKHPQCPPDVLKELLDCDDRTLRTSIAFHRNITPEIAQFFLNSSRKSERLNISLSRHVSSQILLSLLEDKYEEVSKSARKNLTKRFPDLEITEASIKAAIEQYINKPFIKPTTPKPVFDPRSVERSGLTSVLAADGNQRRRIANQSRDPEVLDALAEDKNKAVRLAVAKKPYSAEKTLKKLAKDSSVEISNTALKQLFKEHPKLSAEELLNAHALEAAYREISRHVTKNSTKSFDLDDLGAKEKLAFEQALLVTKHTNNPLIQLSIVKDLDLKRAPDCARCRLLGELIYNWNLSEAIAKRIIVQLKFSPESIIERCRSTALLKELLSTSDVGAHEKLLIEKRLRALVPEQA